MGVLTQLHSSLRGTASCCWYANQRRGCNFILIKWERS